MTTLTQTHSTQNQASYFNLTVDGIGFMNRPRLVQGKKMQDYYACTIQALRGDEDKTRFDVRIVGEEAKAIFERLLETFPQLMSNNDFKNRPTVTIGFRLGDIQPISFESTNRQTGEKFSTLSIDGRLLKFKFIKVNGEFWYREQHEQAKQA